MIANLIAITRLGGAAPTPPPPPGPVTINSWANNAYRVQTSEPGALKYNVTVL